MLTIEEIKDLIKTLDESSINEFVYQLEGEKLKLKKQNQSSKHVEVQSNDAHQQVEVVREEAKTQTVPEPEIQVKPAYDYEIISPMVGTFYLAPSPDSEPYATVGDHVTKQSVVCMIEAMKLFNEIEAEVDGEIIEILAENGELVEYGQPLFGIKKN